MKSKTCCFTGHRTIPKTKLPQIKAELEREIENLISIGVTRFWAGGALGFDTLAADTIIGLRETHHEISLFLALPCRNQESRWHSADRDHYKKILNHCNAYIYLSCEYYNGCMQRRNRFMVDNSDYCIAYISSNKGGTAYTVGYAEHKGINVIKLCNEEPDISGTQVELF